MNTEFAQEWLHAWNSHDLNKIMDHYSENIDFVSPIIQQMQVNAAGKITNKKDLRDYFSKALKKYPDLHFEFYHELKGADSIVLVYESMNNSLSAEYMEQNSEGKVTKVRAHYKLEGL